MSIPTLFITALIMGFSGAMMPGPLLTVDIHESYKRGYQAGPLLILGHGLLELLLVIALVLGLDVLLTMPHVKTGIALGGGLVLLWFGWTMAQDAWLGKVSLQLTVQENKKGMPPVLAGALVSLANPYWVIWWATIGLAYLTLAMEKGLKGIGAFFTGHILADFIWYTGISLAVVSGKKFISDRIYRIILVGCGVFLLVLAFYFLWSGRRFLLEI